MTVGAHSWPLCLKRAVTHAASMSPSSVTDPKEAGTGRGGKDVCCEIGTRQQGTGGEVESCFRRDPAVRGVMGGTGRRRGTHAA